MSNKISSQKLLSYSKFNTAFMFEVKRFAHFNQSANILSFYEAVHGLVDKSGIINVDLLQSTKDRTSPEVYEAVTNVLDVVLEPSISIAQPT